LTPPTPPPAKPHRRRRKDGIIIKARARVTVRTNLDRFVGRCHGGNHRRARWRGIVTTIGSANSYKDVLENPDRISQDRS